MQNQKEMGKVRKIRMYENTVNTITNTRLS